MGEAKRWRERADAFKRETERVQEMHRRAQKAEGEVERLRKENERLRAQIEKMEPAFARWGQGQGFTAA